METTDRIECLSCGWRDEAQERMDLDVKLQTSPVDVHEQACPQCDEE